MRKPPAKVASIKGALRPDLISQEELRELEGLQRMQWQVDKRAALFSERIKSRIEHGANVEAGSLYFDIELEMVRGRRGQGAG